MRYPGTSGVRPRTAAGGRNEDKPFTQRMVRLAVAAAALAAAADTTAQAQTGSPAGAGFYLRAGIALDRPQDARFTDVNCTDSSAAVLYGCGTGLDGAP